MGVVCRSPYHLLVLLGFVVAGLVWGKALQAQENTLPDYVVEAFGNPPDIPAGPLPENLLHAVEVAFIESMEDGVWGRDQTAAFDTISRSNDPRIAWIVSDLMRFANHPYLAATLHRLASDLLGKNLPNQNHWGMVTDHLIAWDIPAPPDYLRFKRAIFTSIIPGWEEIFVEGDIDWRHVSWGGVLIDNRPYDTTDDACNCIPAADNPKVSKAVDATWLKDETIVFGVERPILRTSGLLIRSNKVMYDVNTYSVFDTFLGKAVTGPLRDKNVQLKQANVVTTNWGAWKAAHPETTVLVEELALGRDFDFRNNRDANGPIFPIGDVDPRLPVQEDIIGVLTASDKPIAFQRSKAIAALTTGQKVTYKNVELTMDAGGVKAVDQDGNGLGSHQAFWFAWSQFYPETELWLE